MTNDNYAEMVRKPDGTFDPSLDPHFLTRCIFLHAGWEIFIDCFCVEKGVVEGFVQVGGTGDPRTALSVGSLTIGNVPDDKDHAVKLVNLALRQMLHVSRTIDGILAEVEHRNPEHAQAARALRAAETGDRSGLN